MAIRIVSNLRYAIKAASSWLLHRIFLFSVQPVFSNLKSSCPAVNISTQLQRLHSTWLGGNMHFFLPNPAGSQENTKVAKLLRGRYNNSNWPVGQFEKGRSQESENRKQMTEVRWQKLEVRIRILQQIKNHSGQFVFSAHCYKLLFSRMLSQ